MNCQRTLEIKIIKDYLLISNEMLSARHLIGSRKVLINKEGNISENPVRMFQLRGVSR